jgi:DNA-binding transcriptional LysR family regulator
MSAPISQAFRCLDAVARRGSVRKAAESLHLTAAAVHQQILNLEENVGVPLFDRLPRGMQLTAAGEIVLAAVRRAQRDYDQALAQVADLRALRRGHVSVGAPQSSAETLLPGVIARIRERHPGLRFDVRTGNGETLLRWLANGEVDLAFCLQRPAPPGVEKLRGWRQQLGGVVPPSHELARQPGPIKLHHCLAWPLALPAPDMELRLIAEQVAARERRVLEPSVETTSVAMIRALVRTGGMVSLLLHENVAGDVCAGTLCWIPLTDPAARAEVALYQRAGQSPGAGIGVLVECLDDAFSMLVPA